MREEQTGFFDQFYIACFRPSSYNETLLKKSRGAVAVYIIVLIAFLTLIDTVIPFAAWDASVGGLRNLFLKGLPQFQLKDGEFQARSSLDFTLGNSIHVVVNSQKERFTADDVDKDYIQEFLIGRDNIIVNADYTVQEIRLDSMKNVTLDNQSLVDSLPMIRAVIGLSIFLTAVIKLVEYVFVAAFFALLCKSSVRDREGKTVSLGTAMTISLYAKTLFAIISSVDTALGNPLPPTLLIVVSVFVTMMYISRAEMKVLGIDSKWIFK